MRIAIEAWAAAEVPAGRGRYVRELLHALAALEMRHEIVLLGRDRWEQAPFEWRALPGSGPVWALRAARATRTGFDAVFATTSYALAALAGPPAVATVFDLVAFERGSGVPRGAQLERVTLPLAARRAAGFACISAATRDELVARHPRTAGRAQVTPLAPAPVFGGAVADPAVAARHGLTRPYVLSASTLEPRKNLPRLVEAFAGLPAELRDTHDLVLVGARGWGTDALDASLARHAGLVRTLGYVEDRELASLYAGAALVAYPSLAEGFGLPVLEAMAAGAPVLTSNCSSLPEVAGDAAILVDPLSVGAIRDGLVRALGDPALRAGLAARGRERATGFTWERTARQTLALLESV